MSNFVRQCRSVTGPVTPGVSQRILTVVGKEGIVKQQYHKPLYDASQIYKIKKYATITFVDSPFCGQKGRILKEIAGRHPELHLEMPSGERIKVDLLWTDYREIEPTKITHHIDFSQAEKIIQFLEYLSRKCTKESIVNRK